MNVKITKKLEKIYLKAPGICPVCASREMEGQSYDADGSTITQEVACLECHATWVDIYKLVGIYNLDDGKECEHLNVEKIGEDRRHCNDCNKEWRVD